MAQHEDVAVADLCRACDRPRAKRCAVARAEVLHHPASIGPAHLGVAPAHHRVVQDQVATRVPTDQYPVAIKGDLALPSCVRLEYNQPGRESVRHRFTSRGNSPPLL